MYGVRAQFLGTTSPSSAIAWRSAHHAAIFVKASSFKLLLCKLTTNPTLIAHAPFIFECIYVTCMPPWSSSGLALLQGTHLREPYRRRHRRFPRKSLYMPNRKRTSTTMTQKRSPSQWSIYLCRQTPVE